MFKHNPSVSDCVNVTAIVLERMLYDAKLHVCIRRDGQRLGACFMTKIGAI